MPAAGDEPAILGARAIAALNNASVELPTLREMLVLFSVETGAPLAVLGHPWAWDTRRRIQFSLVVRRLAANNPRVLNSP